MKANCSIDKISYAINRTGAPINKTSSLRQTRARKRLETPS